MVPATTNSYYLKLFCLDILIKMLLKRRPYLDFKMATFHQKESPKWVKIDVRLLNTFILQQTIYSVHKTKHDHTTLTDWNKLTKNLQNKIFSPELSLGYFINSSKIWSKHAKLRKNYTQISINCRKPWFLPKNCHFWPKRAKTRFFGQNVTYVALGSPNIMPGFRKLLWTDFEITNGRKKERTNGRTKAKIYVSTAMQGSNKHTKDLISRELL